MAGGSPAEDRCPDLEGTSTTKAQQNFVIPVGNTVKPCVLFVASSLLAP
jgi:hypothetical protein